MILTFDNCDALYTTGILTRWFHLFLVTLMQTYPALFLRWVFHFGLEKVYEFCLLSDGALQLELFVLVIDLVSKRTHTCVGIRQIMRAIIQNFETCCSIQHLHCFQVIFKVGLLSHEHVALLQCELEVLRQWMIAGLVLTDLGDQLWSLKYIDILYISLNFPETRFTYQTFYNPRTLYVQNSNF